MTINAAQADGMAIPDPSGQNQLDIGSCITAIKVGGAVEAGMYFRFYDSDVQRSEYVDFRTLGPLPGGLNLWGDDKGVNIGYHPTGKKLNLAEREPSSRLSDDDVRKTCLVIFKFDAGVESGSFGQSYVGGDLPSL
ncbi:MAG: hypothetical protein Q9170_002884 [Blastenia crenularia]